MKLLVLSFDKCFFTKQIFIFNHMSSVDFRDHKLWKFSFSCTNGTNSSFIVLFVFYLPKKKNLFAI